jgi:selenocysteine-specific elongation factor
LTLVLGTAGHIDHGKSALVRALTGIDPDRLPVEKQRGITTELGFAHAEIDGRRVAIVDVPGHERFVKSMVAGATGMDAVCLVVAADEGVMPQTREHLAICELLGIPRGIVALTKIDAPGAAIGTATAEVRELVAGTFLDGAPIVPVSALTGAGLDDLRAAIAALADVARDTRAPFRLHVDRVFTVKGFGTVVTGTIAGGAVAVGDEVHALPGERAARVRGIQVHGAAVERAVAGERAALNLAGLAVAELARGDTIAHPGAVPLSHVLVVELRAPLPGRRKVLLHHGTAQRLATLATRKGKTELRMDARTPVAALPGDAFILRGTVVDPVRGSTIGGGRVVERRGAKSAPIAPPKAPPKPALVLVPEDAAWLEQFRAWGIEAPRPRDSGAPKPALDRLLAARQLVRIATELYLHAAIVDDLRARLVAHLREHGTIDAQGWKQLTGASRKYTIPIAEYFDAEKLTLRVGDRRRLR